jgi:hypothetical protein
MKLQATVQAKTTTTVKIMPSVRRRLMIELKGYQADKAAEKAAKARVDKRKGKIGAIREEIGEDSIEIEGFKVTQVRGTTTKINEAKLVELGCALAWIEEAKETKPKKPYEKVTLPGESDKEGE